MTISELRSRLNKKLLSQEIEIVDDCTTIGYLSYNPSFKQEQTLTQQKLDYLIDSLDKMKEKLTQPSSQPELVPLNETRCTVPYCKNIGATLREVVIDCERTQKYMCDTCFEKYLADEK